MDHDRRADDLLGVEPPVGDGPHALAGLAQVHRFSGLIPAPSSKAATAQPQRPAIQPETAKSSSAAPPSTTLAISSSK